LVVRRTTFVTLSRSQPTMSSPPGVPRSASACRRRLLGGVQPAPTPPGHCARPVPCSGFGATPSSTTPPSEPRKNIEGLLEAFSHLPEQLRHSRQLVLVCRSARPNATISRYALEQWGIAGALLLTVRSPTTRWWRSTAAVSSWCSPPRRGYGLPGSSHGLRCPVVASGTASLVELGPAGGDVRPARQRWRWRRASSEHSSTGRCASGAGLSSDHDPLA